jgi:hypothetical protein
VAWKENTNPSREGVETFSSALREVRQRKKEQSVNLIGLFSSKEKDRIIWDRIIRGTNRILIM